MFEFTADTTEVIEHTTPAGGVRTTRQIGQEVTASGTLRDSARVRIERIHEDGQTSTVYYVHCLPEEVEAVSAWVS